MRYVAISTTMVGLLLSSLLGGSLAHASPLSGAAASLARATLAKPPKKKPAPAAKPSAKPARPAPAPTETKSVPAGAPAAQETSVTPRGPTRIDFDDRLIQGQTNKSGAVYLFDRKELAIRSMVRQRTSFRDQIVKDVIDE